MAAGVTTANKAEAPPAAASSGLQWLLLPLTLLLVALAVFQLIYLTPRCAYVVQNLTGYLPATLRLLVGIPEWSVVVAGLVLGAFAVWRRGSLHRVTLLATATLAVNVGLLVSI